MELKPLCECHGEPMTLKKDPRYKRGGFYFCTVKNREKGNARGRRYRQRLAEAGRCIRCGADDPINAVCWNCLSKMEDQRALTL